MSKMTYIAKERDCLDKLVGILYPGGGLETAADINHLVVDASLIVASTAVEQSSISDHEIQELHQHLSDVQLNQAIYGIRRKRLIQSLIELENVSVRAKEVPAVRDTLLEYVQAFHLQKETHLVNAIQSRFSMEYLPGLSTLGLEKYKRELNASSSSSSSSVVHNNNSNNDNQTSSTTFAQTPSKAGIHTSYNSLTPLQNLSSGENLQEYSEAPSPVVGLKKTNPEQKCIPIGPELYKAIHLCSFSKTYLICSVKRHQSTLWVSYRMFLEGYREFDEQGSLTAVVPLEKPIMLFGAKKLKSGISPTCYIWKSLDSKLWKEKTAIAKILHQGNRYVGIPFMDMPTVEGYNKPSFDVDVNQSQSDLVASDALDLIDDDVGLKIDNSDSTVPSAVSQDEINIVELMKGGPVVVTAECKGAEKMIHSNAVYPRHNLAADGDLSSALTTWGEEAVMRYITEIEIMISEPSKFSVYARKFHILRNRMPRKIPVTSFTSTPKKGSSSNSNPSGGESAFTPSKKTQLGLDFGRLSRVTVASRKNLVMEEIFNERGELMNNEWSQESIHPSFQVSFNKPFL